MGHQFVALFGSGIERHGMVHLVGSGIRDFGIAAIDRRTAGIDQMGHLVVTAGFEQVIETHDVAFDVGVGIGDAIAHAGLGSQIDNDVRTMVGKNLVNYDLVGDAFTVENKTRREICQTLKTGRFEAHVIVVRNVVYANYFETGIVGEQALAKIAANETSYSSHQDGLVGQVDIILQHILG